MDEAEELFAVERDQKMWLVLFVLITGALWVHWLGGGVIAEVSDQESSGALMALYLIPLAVATMAVVWRQRGLSLLAVPLSFLPGLWVLPEPAWERLGEPLALGIAGALFGLYLLVAAGRPDTESLVGLKRRSLEEALERSDRYSEEFRRFVFLRMVALGGIFAAITYGLFVDPAAAEAFDSLGAFSADQRVFTAVLLYFAWSIALYMGAILPALNWEHDRRQPVISERLRSRMNSPARLVRQVALWIGAATVLIVLAMWSL